MISSESWWSQMQAYGLWRSLAFRMKKKTWRWPSVGDSILWKYWKGILMDGWTESMSPWGWWREPRIEPPNQGSRIARSISVILCAIRLKMKCLIDRESISLGHPSCWDFIPILSEFKQVSKDGAQLFWPTWQEGKDAWIRFTKGLIDWDRL